LVRPIAPNVPDLGRCFLSPTKRSSATRLLVTGICLGLGVGVGVGIGVGVGVGIGIGIGVGIGVGDGESV
jgi:hypothetical protein